MQQPANSDGDFSSGFNSSSSAKTAYLGRFQKTYAGYAESDGLRKLAASGGIVTALAEYALTTGAVSGFAMVRSDFSDSKVGYKFKIITSPEEVRLFGSSAYFNIPIENHLDEISNFDGSVGICALPCHTSIIRNRIQKGGLENLKLLISLFCGHNNEKELLEFVMKKSAIPVSETTGMKVERSYLGGNVRFTIRDSPDRLLPFRDFNVYRSLGLFGKMMCRYCDDHLGAMSDISIGDIFIPEFRSKEIKHSAVIVRSETGARIFEGALSDKMIKCEEICPEKIFDAQKRVLVPSSDLKSRYYACRFWGLPANKKLAEGTPFRLRSFLTYALLLMNSKISRSEAGRTIFRIIPRPLLYCYIAVIKLINNTLSPKRSVS